MVVKHHFVLRILPLFLLLYGCSIDTKGEDHETGLKELMSIVSNPDAQEFAMATKELAEMGSEAAPASELLADALSFPRRDSYTAGIALISIGKNSLPACSGLRIALSDERSKVRIYAAAALGAIGKSAEGAVPDLANHLWDEDAWVRTAATGALEQIVRVDLLPNVYELDSTNPGSVSADEPNGRLSSEARRWWSETGKGMEWSDQGHCKLK